MAAPKTETPKAVAAVEVVEVLDTFEDRLITVESITATFEFKAVLAKVVFGEVIGGMFGALDEELPALKADASGSEKAARKDIIRQRIMSYIAEKTGRYYSWANLDAWRKAGVTNSTLPEAVRVILVEDESGDPAKADISGVFGVWPLQYLAAIEDEDVRASFAEELAEKGITSQQAVKLAVAEKLGKNTTPDEPKAAAAMAEALAKSFRNAEKALVGKVEHVMLTTDEDDAALLATFGRVLWSRTKADAAETDPETRKRKRVEVFSQVVAMILFSGVAAEEDDGAVQDGDAPIL